ncbi:MAG: ABC transporter ATP-binding protein [Pseudomonadota bacterium]
MTDALSVQGLVKRFGGLTATDHVDLTLRPGEIHALIGPNGAGKSTLIGQIAGLIPPDEGRVSLGGEDITALPVAARARLGLGRSFQISSLGLPLSARRNAMLAAQGRCGSSFRFWRPARRDPEITGPAEAALARVGLADRMDVPAAELSHGERRQLEVACALALAPKALLLDEPMAGLGPEGSARLTTLLDGLRAEAPILLVEHDMDAVFALADRISVLVYGRVIASGSVDEIRRDPAVREAYLGEAA